MSDRKTVLSCIQPTGNMHIGNYFGAVKNWVDLQEKYKCIYGVVDYHAMTMPYDVKKLRNNTWELIFNMIAVGLEPGNIFVQSLVPEHSELAWIFNCFCSYGHLTRMTQFKDKSQQVGSGSKETFVSVGLLDYPVLQSADILIYKADYVPVGKDQTQHLELTRDIAQRFNYQVGKEYFVLPEGLYTKTPNVKSTADPSRKMSKSAGEKHHIGVFADEARIRKQIRSAVTDSGETAAGIISDGVENLFGLLKAMDETKAYNHHMDTFTKGEIRYADLKADVAEPLVAMTNGFKERKAEITADKRTIKDQIKTSSEEIRKIAKETVREVKDLVGLLNVK